MNLPKTCLHWLSVMRSKRKLKSSYSERSGLEIWVVEAVTLYQLLHGENVVLHGGGVVHVVDGEPVRLSPYIGGIKLDISTSLSNQSGAPVSQCEGGGVGEIQSDK